MGINGLPTQLMQIPLAAGLNQKPDVRSKQPPSLDICKDVQFDETGGVQTRKPYSAIGTLDTNDNQISAFRTVKEYGDELVMCSKDAIYSRLSNASRWVKRADHPAIVVDESIVYASNDDQQYGDRAELNGVVFYAWVEQSATTTFVVGAARDKTTGATILPPFSLSGASRPRLVVSGSRIMMFVYFAGTTTLRVYPIDVSTPASIVASLSTPSTISAASGGFYDVCLTSLSGGGTTVGGATTITGGASYLAFAVTTAGVVTTASKARTSNGPTAVASGTANLLVVYCNGTNVVADQLLPNTLADVRVADAVYNDGLQPSQLSAAFSSGTEFSIWSSYIGWQVKCGFITSAGVVTATAMRAAWCELVSRAFTSETSDLYTYVWLVQNPAGTGTGSIEGIYVLMRSDGLVVAKTRSGNAGTNTMPVSGWGGSVQATSGTLEFGWLGVFQRPFESAVGASVTRSNRDVVFQFDSNAARRMVQFGQTLYITGGLPLQYDGTSVVEVGAIVAPAIVPQVDSGAATGALSAGTYAYKTTTRWMNAKGEVDRSTSLGVATITVIATHTTTDAGVTPQLWLTRKQLRTHETWRTRVNPTADDPFYLVSSQLTSAVANPNRYVVEAKNGTIYTNSYLVTFTDGISDATLLNLEEHPETGDQLENLSPPPHRIAMAATSRMFIAGVAGVPDQVWYSKYREVGKIVAFNDALTIDVPATGGDITALAILNETLIVFREFAVYAFAGDGYDNTGGGQNYAPAHTVTLDVGAISQESVVVTDSGIIFKSSKGWHMLDRGLSVAYIGGPIDDYDGESVLAAHLMPGQHQARIVTTARVLVFDDNVGQWAEWSIADGISACLWQGLHVYLSSSTGAMQQRTDYTGVTYGMDVETAWIKLNDLQGNGRVRAILALGEFRSTHKLRIRVAQDYEYASPGVPNYVDDVAWAVTQTIVGGPEQVKHGPSSQTCQSIKVRFTAVATDGVSAPTGESLKLTGIAMRVGVYPTPNTRLSAAQKD